MRCLVYRADIENCIFLFSKVCPKTISLRDYFVAVLLDKHRPTKLDLFTVLEIRLDLVAPYMWKPVWAMIK